MSVHFGMKASFEKVVAKKVQGEFDKKNLSDKIVRTITLTMLIFFVAIV